MARASDFDAMLTRIGSEVGIGIDDQAGIVVDGDQFRVVATENAGTSNKVTKKVVDRSGKIKETIFRPDSRWHPLRELTDT